MEKFTDYEVKDTGHSFRIGIGGFGMMEIYYEHPRVTTPVKKDKAEEWANHFKVLLENEYPFDDLDLSEYESSGMDSLLEALMKDDDCDCDDDDCDCDKAEISGRDLMQLMMMKAMMD